MTAKLKGVSLCYIYSDRVGLRNRATVQKLQSLYLQCLYFQLKGQHPGNSGIVRLP